MCSALLLVRRQFADLDEVRQWCAREFMRVDVAAIRPECDEAVGMLQSQVPGADAPIDMPRSTIRSRSML